MKKKGCSKIKKPRGKGKSKDPVHQIVTDLTTARKNSLLLKRILKGSKKFKKGIPINEFSKITGIARNEICKIENGAIKNPGLLTLAKIALLFRKKIILADMSQEEFVKTVFNKETTEAILGTAPPEELKKVLSDLYLNFIPSSENVFSYTMSVGFPEGNIVDTSKIEIEKPKE